MLVLPSSKVVFSNTRDALEIESKFQIEALKNAFKNGEKVFVTPEEIDGDKLRVIGTELSVEQILSPFPEVAKVLFTSGGQYVLNVLKETAENVYQTEIVSEFELFNVDTDTAVLLSDRMKMLFLDFLELSVENGHAADMDDDPEENFSLIASIVRCRQLEIYLEHDYEKRLILLNGDLENQIEVLKLEQEIEVKVKDAADQNQKEFYIREQIRQLNDELGESDDADDYLDKIEKSTLPSDIKEKLTRDVKRMRNMSLGSPEMAMLKNYLDAVFELPYGVYTEDNYDLKRARELLDRDHFGMKKVKDRLIEALAVRILTKNGKSPILCLVGPAGVGKTSVARSIADAMNKKYVRVSFGGVHDEAEIRGHRKTYIGSMPGRIINGMATAGSMNPVFLMDEVDKMASDYKGDPAAALLEVLDPEQNKAFRDHYLEIPFDLSQVLFITTANSLENISRPLLDRMEVIEMSGYTIEEKREIAKRHLIVKMMRENGIEEGWVKITDKALETVIERYTKESGVRGLTKQLAKIMRRVAMLYVEKPDRRQVVVNDKNLKDFLGKPIYDGFLTEKEDTVGAANGLAWTEVGGETLPVEVCSFDGKGDIILTGSLGDVMKESARIGLSYLRSAGYAKKLPEDFFKTHDLHIHVPEGATPKDGPSAGITMATAMVSLMKNVPVRADTAMTGEITLLGNVLPIGGLKEKSLAALRSGAKRVILPDGNRKDYEELPESVKKNMEFCFVKTADEVFNLALRSSL